MCRELSWGLIFYPARCYASTIMWCFPGEGSGTVFLQRWENGNYKDQVISGKSYFKPLSPPLCIYSLSFIQGKSSLLFSMESTGLERYFWHYFFLVKPLRPVALFPGGISLGVSLCRSGWDPSKPVGSKTCCCFCPVQAAAWESSCLSHHPCFYKDSDFMLQHVCEAICEFYVWGEKTCFLCSKQPEGQVTTLLASPSHRVLLSISNSHVFGLQLCNWSKKILIVLITA